MHADPALEAAVFESDDLDTTPVAESTLTLSQVAIGQTVVIRAILSGVAEGAVGDIGLRLLELGFVEGELLRVIAHGYPGGEPIAVRIGNTTFALRRFEADHVLVRGAPLHADR